MNIECDNIIAEMKCVLNLLLLLLVSLTLFGQNLCDDCAISIRQFNSNECCEDCLRNYFREQLKRNFTHGNIYSYDDDNESIYVPLPDSILSSVYQVWDIKSKSGYILNELDNFCSHSFYLVFLQPRCDSVQLSSMVLVTDDISNYKIGGNYKLTLIPFFLTDCCSLIVEDNIYPIIGPSHILFDMVYRNFLIPKLPLGRNYFFEGVNLSP